MSAALAFTPEPPIQCGGCTRVLTPRDWYSLKYVGRWALDVGALELRICACGSCISRERPALTSGERPAVREAT